MKEFVMMAAMTLPLEHLVSDLKIAISEYEKDPSSKEAKSKLSFSAMMLSIHMGTEGKDVVATIKDFSEKEKLVNAFEESKY